MTRSLQTRVLTALAAVFIAAPAARAQVSVEFPLTLDNLPTYNRVNGVSVPFTPTLTVGDDRLVVSPAITYRSHLGKIDPSLSIV